MLEDSGDTVAPPRRPQPSTPASLLPPKPAFAWISETSQSGTPACTVTDPAVDADAVVDANEADADEGSADDANAHNEHRDVEAANAEQDEVHGKEENKEAAEDQDAEEQGQEAKEQEQEAEEQEAEEQDAEGENGEANEPATNHPGGDDDMAGILNNDDGRHNIRTPSPDNQGASRTKGKSYVVVQRGIHSALEMMKTVTWGQLEQRLSGEFLCTTADFLVPNRASP
jgi:hypothetical protein